MKKFFVRKFLQRNRNEEREEEVQRNRNEEVLNKATGNGEASAQDKATASSSTKVEEARPSGSENGCVGQGLDLLPTVEDIFEGRSHLQEVFAFLSKPDNIDPALVRSFMTLMMSHQAKMMGQSSMFTVNEEEVALFKVMDDVFEALSPEATTFFSARLGDALEWRQMSRREDANQSNPVSNMELDKGISTNEKDGVMATASVTVKQGILADESNSPTRAQESDGATEGMTPKVDANIAGNAAA